MKIQADFVMTINGEAVTTEQTQPVFNPATRSVFAQVPDASREHLDQAVDAAQAALKVWSATPADDRQKALEAYADLIESHAEELLSLLTAEQGKPRAGSEWEVFGSVAWLRAVASLRLPEEVVEETEDRRVVTRFTPVGVVGAIVPWNFPTYCVVLKAAPALAAGNSVIVKPSELASRSAIIPAKLALKAGVPAGVLNVVPGLGEIVGKALGLHPDVNMITFTGSTSVGKMMLNYASQSNLKYVMTECGGKSPQIIFDDGVDLDVAASAVAELLLVNQGQLCCTGSRVLVQKSISQIFAKKVSDCLQKIVMGDSLDKATTFGPIVSEKQFNRVLSYIEKGLDDGCELVTGGDKVSGSEGFFIQPTLFTNVNYNSRIAQEEIFGPILALIEFSDLDEAIEIANSTQYGLAAYAWTSSLSTGMRLMKEIKSGIFINSEATQGEGASYAMSIEPYGESGFGPEGGLAGLENYFHRRLAWFNHGG